MKSKFYLLWVWIFLSVSCANLEKREVVDLMSDKVMNRLSDSSFFSSIPCIGEYDGDIYMSDRKRCQIFRLDSNLNLLKTIGMQGHGPQDFGYIEHFVILKDTIFVGDVTKMRILRFTTDGQFCGSENPDGKIPLNYRFAMNADNVFYSYVEGVAGKALIDYDRKSGQLNWFGRTADFGHPNKTKRQNERGVHLWGDRLVVVPMSIPVIEIYHAGSRELEQSVDISSVPVVQAMYRKMANDRTIASSPDSFYLIFLDSYLHQDALYILASVYVNDKLDHSALLEFDLSHGGAEWVRQYDFPDWVLKICVTDDYIYGFVPKSSSIKRYPLPKH
ncbi:6-bladed beta-propeller [uncultured Rikenella sp.]|uniref:6-bladed beta-propeller n=1 Tax=uncultured Rikenella sp. TaxID=368003 RepID=UPI002607B74F|nr:6-bladed beta-propeller [uncultured Rikenella sp.]